MYIKEITIHNIRSIQSFSWFIRTSECAGWHVIIGDNGSGKSTLLRSIALALVGPTEAVALRQNWNDWLTKKSARGSIELSLSDDRDFDKFSGRGRRIENYFLPVRLTLQSKDNDVILQYSKIKNFDPMRFVWGSNSGWFSAGFGPFRRFRGGDKDYDKLFYSNPKLVNAACQITTSIIRLFGKIERLLDK